MGTGELRNFGYQQPMNAKGPIRATDLGVGSLGQSSLGYGKGNFGNYDSYD